MSKVEGRLCNLHKRPSQSWTEPEDEGCFSGTGRRSGWHRSAG